MDNKKALDVFRETGALLKGHFKLSSGLHSAEYLQCALLLQHPERAQVFCKELADKFKDAKPTVVAAPAIGGIVVSYEVARALNCRSVFLEREDGRMRLRRGFTIDKTDRVLVVEDVITTGRSTKEVLDAINIIGANIVGIGSIVDRSCTDIDFSVDFRYVLKVRVDTFKPEECPLCRQGAPAVKPGSRKEA
ncbi:MAG: orotate phosphoribosyltransferase [Candidatus Omnitrophota bacterium]